MSDGTRVHWRGVTIAIPPEIANETAEVIESYELAAFAEALGVSAAEVERLRAEESGHE